jgi:hypothetical protein
MAFLVIATLGTACAYRIPDVHVPADFSSAVVDASVVYANGQDVEPDVQADYRREIQDLLKASGGPRVASVHARVVIRSYSSVFQFGPIAVLYFPFMFAGAQTHFGTISIDLTVESEGQVFEGHGEASDGGGIYASPRRRVLAIALDQALAALAPRSRGKTDA